MLEYDRINDKVVPIDNCHLVPNPLNSLYKSARQKDKPFFWSAIKYAYFMYKKDGIYENEFPRERARTVGRMYFGDKDIWRKFEENEKFKEFKDFYIKLQYDATERSLLKSSADIEDLLDHLSEIDYYVKKKVEVELNVPKSLKAPEETEKHLHMEWINISNFEEKKKALVAIKEIISVRKLLQEEAKKRRIEQKNEASKSLMDRGFFNEN